MFPDGEAGRLLGELALPCAHCGGAFHEPLTLAATAERTSRPARTRCTAVSSSPRAASTSSYTSSASVAMSTVVTGTDATATGRRST